MKTFREFNDSLSQSFKYTQKGHKYIQNELKDINIPNGYTLGFHGSKYNFTQFDKNILNETEEFGFHFAQRYFGTQYFTSQKDKNFKNYLYVCALPIKEKLNSKFNSFKDSSYVWGLYKIIRDIIRHFDELYSKSDNKLNLKIFSSDLARYSNYKDEDINNMINAYNKKDYNRCKNHMINYLEKNNINCIEYTNTIEPPIGEKVYMMLDVGSTIDDIKIIKQILIDNKLNSYP